MEMNVHSKPVKIGLFFLGLIAICGVVLLFKGNDAVAMAKEKRDGIVTAEQIKVSFDSVSGRLLKENVKEGDQVKKGDVLMVMDATDTDLDIRKLHSQIAQLDAEISSMAGDIDVACQKADTDEVETHRQIDQQKAVLASSQAVYENKLSDYNRKLQLVEAGAISQLEMDNITANLRTAEADVRAQQELLHKLLGGAEDRDNTEDIALPTIAQERQSADNKANDLESLKQQKKQLEVALEQK
jgi:HlyD family secretion protein